MSRAPPARRCGADGCRQATSLGTEAAFPVSAWLCEGHAEAFWQAGEGRRLIGIRNEAGAGEDAERLQHRSAAAVGDFIRRVAAEARAS